MPETAVVIPARWASTRFPGKPLHRIAGKPLLQHVCERCLRAKVDAVIVATDDARIADAARAWGVEIAMTSRKHPSGSDRVAEVVRGATDLKFIVNVQGDEPLIDPRLIDRIVATLRTNRPIGIVTAAHPFANLDDAKSPNQVKVVIDRNSNALYFSRAAIPFPREQAARPLRHQGIYGYRRDVLLQFVRWKRSPLERTEALEQLRALENGVRIHVLVTKSGTPGVDTPEDAAALEHTLARAQRRNRRR